MKRTDCPVCRAFSMGDPLTGFACPVCNRTMLQLHGDSMGDVVLHCPDHCSSLIPGKKRLNARRKT